METGDICPYCLDADCPSTVNVCPGRVLMAKDVFGPIPPGSKLTDDTPVVFSAKPPVSICGFCYGSGGYRVPCHSCGVVGPVAA